ncbi:MAG: YheU family protein [Pseudomonadota bacterium]
MKIPYDELSSDVLRALLESVALREGTEYGEQDVELEIKIQQLMRQLERQETCVVFDHVTQSCDVITMDKWNELNQQA